MFPSRDSNAVDLPVVLDRSSEITLPVQLAAALRDAIDQDTLRPGETLPATRALAMRLGVARGVIVAAYEQLTAEGYLYAAHGRGTMVHPQLQPSDPADPADPSDPAESATVMQNITSQRIPKLPNIQIPEAIPPLQVTPQALLSEAALPAPRTSVSHTVAAQPTLSKLVSRAAANHSVSTHGPAQEWPVGNQSGPLSVGSPDTETVDTPAWRAAWRTAVAQAHVEAPELGDVRLREEIADHLRRMRGTRRAAEDIVVTAGARGGLHLLLTALAQQRGRALNVGVEEPGFPSLRRVVAMHSAHIVPVAVDADGLDPRQLPTFGLDAVIVTPSHQYPLGGSLPLARRRELLAWAAESGALIIEDDYDSELRHAGSPLPALAALDNPVHGSVALLGTFSKTVSPALSAGYLLVPANIRALVEPVQHDLGGSVSAVVQAALAEYLASGELRRHTARMRRRYAARRALVLERLGGITDVRVRPMNGGLHAVLELGGAAPANIEMRLAEAIAESGLGGVPLSTYWRGGSAIGERYGLVIGTGRARTEEFDAALRILRQLLVTLGDAVVSN